MNKHGYRSFPRWAFVILAMGAFWASGVYFGILSVEGVSSAILVRAVGFGVIGLPMAWGAIAAR